MHIFIFVIQNDFVEYNLFAYKYMFRMYMQEHIHTWTTCVHTYIKPLICERLTGSLNNSSCSHNFYD